MMNYIQRLGKSLMLPVSVMPIAALLKGVGYWIDHIGWGSNNWIAAFLIESGTVIIDNLPLLFAVGIAIGMIQERDMTVAPEFRSSYYTIIYAKSLSYMGFRTFFNVNILFFLCCVLLYFVV